MSQQTAIISPPGEPWHRRLLSSTRNRILAIVGVLLLGGGVALALTQLSGNDPEPASSPAQQEPGAGPTASENEDAGGGEDKPQKRRAAVDPSTVTVAVLNGTLVTGLAQQVSDEISGAGFNVGTVANSSDQQQARAESVILYARGSERAAAAVSRRLRIPQREPVDAATQALAGDATVVVITGADRSR